MLKCTQMLVQLHLIKLTHASHLLQCTNKGRECRYVPSRRGGPRPCARRGSKAEYTAKPRAVATNATIVPSHPGETAISTINDLQHVREFTQLTTPHTAQNEFPHSSVLDFEDVLKQTSSMAGPGAGLRALDALDSVDMDSDAIFDSVFGVTNGNAHHELQSVSGERTPGPGLIPIVRTYRSDQDM